MTCRSFAAVLLIVLIAGVVSGTEPFHFVQITDTHFGVRDHEERTKGIVDMINRLPMDIAFVVHTGDIMTDNIQRKDILQTGVNILKKLKPPLYFLPGNHDILVTDCAATKKTYMRNFGQLNHTYEYNGVVFIFLYTEPLAVEFKDKFEEPLKILESELKRAGGKPVVVFHHTPSVDDFYNNKMHAGWDADIRVRWEKLLNSANVKAVIAGHFHRDEFHWIGDVPMYVSSSVAGFWGRQASFRIYEYNDGKLSYRTQYLIPSAKKRRAAKKPLKRDSAKL